MNRIIIQCVFLYGILVVAIPLSAQIDGEFTLRGSTIQGSKGTSKGGGFTLTHIVRQLNVTSLQGGSYTLIGRATRLDSFLQGVSCLVDIEDLALFVSQWLKSGDLEANFDWDGDPDNVVNLYDYTIFATFWMGNCPENWPWQ